MPPVFQTSTFAQRITRGQVLRGNTNTAVRQIRDASGFGDALASIENGARGLAFPRSGLAATDCLLRMFKAGDEIIQMDNLCTRRKSIVCLPVCTKTAASNSILCRTMNDLDGFQKLINENTKLVWVETPTNPLMKLAHIAEIAKITKKHNILFAGRQHLRNPVFAKTVRFRCGYL